MSSNKTLEQRFWEKVDRTRGEHACWRWLAAKTDQGYGSIKVDGRTALAHRVSYSMAGGDLSKAVLLDHVCFNRSCVNPRHLRPVTKKQNNEHVRGAQVNSKSGIRGVSWHKQAGKWRVQVTHNRKIYRGVYFADINAADEAACALRGALFSHDDYQSEVVRAESEVQHELDGKAIARAAEGNSTPVCD